MADHDTHDHTGVPGAGSPTEITDIPTAETDTTKVLSPDGGGGVEWATASTFTVDTHACSIYNSATQNPGTGAVLFNTDIRDTGGLHDTGSNTSRITVNVTGWWLFLFASRVDTASGGVRPKKNGTGSFVGATCNLSSISNDNVFGQWMLYLTSGDYVEFFSNQSQTFGHGSAFEAQTQATAAFLGA